MAGRAEPSARVCRKVVRGRPGGRHLPYFIECANGRIPALVVEENHTVTE